MSQDSIADDLSDLIRSTLGKNESSGINAMLECIAKRLGAFGCSLWEVSAEAEQSREPAKRCLVTVASWWKTGDLFAMDDVPLDDSPAARVALSQRSEIIPNIRTDGGAKKGHPFWKRNSVEGMCAVPVLFMDGCKGVLNVYRQAGEKEFTMVEQERLERIGELVPGIYRAIRERIGLKLVSTVESMLRDAEGTTDPTQTIGGKPINKTKVFRTLQKVAVEIGKAFNCVETSLFLEDLDSPAGTDYRCVATTNPKCFSRKTYHAVRDAGRLTGWVLANWAPIRVLDLAKLDRDASTLQRDYKGLQRPHGVEDMKDARRLFKLKAGDDPPPLSFMAVPVFGGNDWLFGGTDLRGVIRCHLSKEGPYFFSPREVNLLCVVAAQIGQWWARWRTRVELEQENKSWNALVKRMAELNTFVRDELQKPMPDEGAMLRKALRLTSAVIPGAELNGIRLHNAARNELYFSEFSPEAETELKRMRKTKSALPTFPIKPRSKYAGVRVFLTGKPYAMIDAHSDPCYHPIFPSVNRMLIVPIGVGDERDGVLDLRWNKKTIPPYAEEIALLLGQQLGIYKQLVKLVTSQRAAAAEAENQKLEEASAYEDFVHQLRSPINQAKLRAELGLAASESDDEQHRWLVVRGLIRRSELVATSMRILSELSHGRRPDLKRTVLDRDEFVRRLIELASDSELHVHTKGIRFNVERETFTHSICRRLYVDVAVLEQMVSNLLDNAGKYGRPRSKVRIFAGITQTERIYIGVANVGLRFEAIDTERAKQRGWRSLAARMVSTEGRGIGLWLVNQLMKAHGGELQILSPNTIGETEVRLAFNPT